MNEALKKINGSHVCIGVLSAVVAALSFSGLFILAELIYTSTGRGSYQGNLTIDIAFVIFSLLSLFTAWSVWRGNDQQKAVHRRLLFVCSAIWLLIVMFTMTLG